MFARQPLCYFTNAGRVCLCSKRFAFDGSSQIHMNKCEAIVKDVDVANGI